MLTDSEFAVDFEESWFDLQPLAGYSLVRESVE